MLTRYFYDKYKIKIVLTLESNIEYQSETVKHPRLINSGQLFYQWKQRTTTW